MTTPNPQPPIQGQRAVDPGPAVSGTVLVATIGAVFCFVVAATVVITIAVPEGGNPGSLVALLLGAFGTVVPTLISVYKISAVGRVVDDLSNGRMDSKIRAGVADVLAEHLIDPAAVDQLHADRARRSRQD